jgi:hypothetical protein
MVLLFKERYSQFFMSIVYSMLSVDPNSRPDYHQVREKLLVKFDLPLLKNLGI